MTGGSDPVDDILDKIDAELDAMDQTATKVRSLETPLNFALY